MIQQPNNHLNKLFLEFSMFYNLINHQNWKNYFNNANQILKLKIFKFQKFSSHKILSIYKSIVQRFYQTEKSKDQWVQNQLRVYVWLIICYSQFNKKPYQQFDINDWNYFSHFFVGKTGQICQFQYLSLRKVATRNQKWTKQQDKILQQIMRQCKIKNQWNKLARQLFLRSNKKYFKNPKQCRQRWNNYLDSNKIRGDWAINDDYCLINYVMHKGKKWANIGKLLDNKRTEHMVKNRYKTLIGKQKKKNAILKKNNLTQNDALCRIMQNLKIKMQTQTNNFQISELISISLDQLNFLEQKNLSLLQTNFNKIEVKIPEVDLYFEQQERYIKYDKNKLQCIDLIKEENFEIYDNYNVIQDIKWNEFQKKECEFSTISQNQLFQVQLDEYKQIYIGQKLSLQIEERQDLLF